MNLVGSYKALRNNSKSAMIAAIEIYNKPQMLYRNECFSILLVNAWELLLKSILSKNKKRIYYAKKPNQSYKTLSLDDSLKESRGFFPAHISFEPIERNISKLSEYRNNSTHFYNQSGFEIIIYGLAQTSIVNYRDLMLAIFNIDISNEINISLLPLAFGTQPDPIQFLQKAKENPPKSKVIAKFIEEISSITRDLEARALDTGRFLTVFKVKMESIKKVGAADVLVGVQPVAGAQEPIYIERRIDPNISHPENQTSIIQKLGNHVNDIKFGPYQFQAVIWKHDIKNKQNLCWHTGNGAMVRYSTEVTSLIRRLTENDIQIAVQECKDYMKNQKNGR